MHKRFKVSLQDLATGEDLAGTVPDVFDIVTHRRYESLKPNVVEIETISLAEWLEANGQKLVPA